MLLGSHYTVTKITPILAAGARSGPGRPARRGGDRAPQRRPRVLAPPHRPRHLRHRGGQEQLRAGAKPVPAGTEHRTREFDAK